MLPLAFPTDSRLQIILMIQNHAKIRSVLLLALALGASTFLTQCETVDTLALNSSAATPRHGFAKNEYPFDRAGNYREDWVRYP